MEKEVQVVDEMEDWVKMGVDFEVVWGVTVDILGAEKAKVEKVEKVEDEEVVEDLVEDLGKEVVEVEIRVVAAETEMEDTMAGPAEED